MSRLINRFRPPGGPRKSPKPRRMALGGPPEAPEPPGPGPENLKGHTFCRALLSGPVELIFGRELDRCAGVGSRSGQIISRRVSLLTDPIFQLQRRSCGLHECTRASGGTPNPLTKPNVWGPTWPLPSRNPIRKGGRRNRPPCLIGLPEGPLGHPTSHFEKDFSRA